MQTKHLVSIRDFCVYHRIDTAFVQTLEQRGLVQIITVEQSLYVPPDEVSRLEKFVRLHQDLAIHADDLDIVNDLLERLEGLQQRVTQLQNQLAFYEPSGR